MPSFTINFGKSGGLTAYSKRVLKGLRRGKTVASIIKGVTGRGATRQFRRGEKLRKQR